MTIDRRNLLKAAALTGAGLALPAFAKGVTPGAMLTPAAMRADTQLLAEAYSTLHPGLGRYLRPGEFAARAAALTDWGQRERRAVDYYLELARLTAAVRCGHSFPNPVNQSDAFVASALDKRDRVPFAFRWLGGRMVVERALAPGLPIAPGTVIDRIDGIAASQLLARLLPLARADGGNDGKRTALMEVDGAGRFGLFDVYSPMLRESRGDGLVRVEAGGRRYDLPAMTEAERKAARGPADERVGWRFTVEQGVGVLTMPDWALYNSKWDWRAFMDSAVDRLIDEKARGLIVDIRDNEGGQGQGEALIARLIERPLMLPRYDRYVRYVKAPAALTPYLDTWDKSFLDWGGQARPSDRAGLLRLERENGADAGTIEPRGRRFGGKVAVLADATCSSATFTFCQTIKEARLGRLIGTETGGNQRGINGGAYFFLRLPETGMEVDLPLIGYYPDRARPDGGMVPDIRVEPTARDLASGRDRQMAAARKWIG